MCGADQRAPTATGLTAMNISQFARSARKTRLTAMHISRLARSARKSVPFYFLLGAVLVIFLFPFYWGFLTSLKFEVEIYDFTGNFLVPKKPSLDHYATLFKTPRYFIWFWNTFFVSAVTTIASVIVSVMAGFAIARLRFRGAALAGTLVFITYLAPKNFLFVPLAQILKDWGLLLLGAADGGCHSVFDPSCHSVSAVYGSLCQRHHLRINKRMHDISSWIQPPCSLSTRSSD
jgi:ABC-type Fe3+ transport system permease subunit